MVRPMVIADIASEYTGKVKVGKVNTDLEPELAGQFGVMSIPSFFFIKNGKVVSASVGGMSKAALNAKLEELIAS